MKKAIYEKTIRLSFISTSKTPETVNTKKGNVNS